MAVCGEADDREDDAGAFVFGTLASDLEDLGREACVDVVAGGVAGVAGEDGEVCAADSERGAAVVGVARGIVKLGFGVWRSMGFLRVEAVFSVA